MTPEQHQEFIEYALEIKWNRDAYSRAWIIEHLMAKVDELVKNCSIPDAVGQSEQLVCNIEKGTRCNDSFPSYKDGKCHNCGGQAN